MAYLPPIIPVKDKMVHGLVKSGAHKAPSTIVPVSKTGHNSGFGISHLVDHLTAVQKKPPPSAILVVAGGKIISPSNFTKPSNWWSEGCRSFA